MFFLPKGIIKMLDLTADESKYSALCGLRLLRLPDGGFRAEATDGKKMLIVQEAVYEVAPECVLPPPLAGLEGVAEADAATLPVKPLREALRKCKDNDRVIVRLYANEATFQVAGMSWRCPTVEGRWPNTDQVIPKSGAGARTLVDPAHFAEWLDAVRALGGKQGVQVELCVPFKQGDILTLTGHTEDGLLFDGVLMPLTPAAVKHTA